MKANGAQNLIQAPRWAPKMYTRFVSHSKPFYPNDSMSLEYLDVVLEIPIHRVQGSVFKV